MAEQKQGAYGELRAEVAKTTPVLIDKLPEEVQAALRRQLGYKTTTGEKLIRDQWGTRSIQELPTPIGGTPYGAGPQEVVNSTDVQDRKTLSDAGLRGRTILLGPKGTRGEVGNNRQAFTVDADGQVTSVASRIIPQSSTLQVAGGPKLAAGRDLTFADASGKAMGAIRTSREGVKMSPKMSSKGFSSAMNLGPMMYQMMTQDVDTDFTVKMIPPQFRKPDETGKMREAVVIVNGQPYVQYEGEAYNVPGYEDIGEDLAAYFRENSALSAGKNKLGSDVGESGMEVRESEEQSLRKKVDAGTREAAKSTGPAKGGTPTFEDEYRVGKPKKDPGIPSGYDMLRGN